LKIYNNRDYESIKSEGIFTEALYDDNMDGMNCCNPCQPQMMGETMPGVVCPPIYECPRETVCHRYICHEVPQD